jgi:hypothetical protein
MPNSPNGPYDDVFSNLAKIVEDIVRNMPDHQNARILGYTIITRHPAAGGQEIYTSGAPDDDGEIPYEVTESDDTLFITAEVSPCHGGAPYASIQKDKVLIAAGDKCLEIDLPGPIDVIQSNYRVRRRVMDITLVKTEQSKGSDP